jgi:peptidoglycan/LPS O-acetylase OafA/YrhL
LDALRGLAAISVVVYHYTADYAFHLHVWLTNRPLELPFHWREGHYGVDLFFIISGFVISLTLDRAARCYDFVASRTARLWPAYLCCLGLTALLVWAWNLSWPPTVLPSVLLAHLPMTPGLFGIQFLDGSYWTLQYELMFYILAAGIFYTLGLRWIEASALFWLSLNLVNHLVASTRIHWLAENLLAVKFSPLFLMGAMLYRFRTGRGTPWTWAILILSLASCAWGPGYPPFRPIPRLGYVALVAILAALVWVGSLERSPLARLRPLIFLGMVSYPLYLIHQTAGYGVMRKLMAMGVSPTVSVLLTILLAVLVATGIHYGIERPGRRKIRDLFARGRIRVLGLPEAPSGAPAGSASQSIP